MKKLLLIALVLFSFKGNAQVTPFFPPRTPVSGQPQRVIQDTHLRAWKSLWIPYTASTTASIISIDSVGSNVQLLSNGNLSISKGLGLGTWAYLPSSVISSIYAPLSSPSFTGNPIAPTQVATANSTTIATTAHVKLWTNSLTGWATYTDNVYTSGSPLVISAAATATIPNNAATSIVTQLPDGVSSFYNSGTSKITPASDGDSYLINVRFTAVSSSTSGLADVAIDIGGAMNIISQETISLRKGIGNSQRVNIIFDVFSGATFIANGGLIKLTSIDGDTSIYDISYKVTRTHKAK